MLYTSARRQGDFQAEAWGLLDQIESLLALGDQDRAMPLLGELVPFLAEDIGQSEHIWGYGLLAVGWLRAGRLGEALEAACQANAASGSTAPVAVYTYEGYAGAAEVLLELGERRQLGLDVPYDAGQTTRAVAALRAYAKVFPIAGPRAALCEGRLAWLEGKQSRAIHHLRRALARAEIMAMPYELGRAA